MSELKDFYVIVGPNDADRYRASLTEVTDANKTPISNYSNIEEQTLKDGSVLISGASTWHDIPLIESVPLIGYDEEVHDFRNEVAYDGSTLKEMRFYQDRPFVGVDPISREPLESGMKEIGDFLDFRHGVLEQMGLPERSIELHDDFNLSELIVPPSPEIEP